MRVALVHDWLVAHRGGEQVLLELARMYPDAPIFTLVCDRSKIHPELASRTIVTSAIQRVPGGPAKFRRWFPLFTAALEGLDVSDFELVLSTSHCVAKGVRTHSGQVHLSYIHTPMRYIWDQLEGYLPGGPLGRLMAPGVERLVRPLRSWDVRTAAGPTRLVANSKYVRDRIKRYWGRDAAVVYPPVDTEFFTPSSAKRSRELLVLGAQVAYKNTTLAIRYATQASAPLRVLGDGPALEGMRSLAGPTVVFEGHVSRERVREAYQQARALLFCGREDFGMVPVEAMACGCPVVALAAGGALESVVGTGREPTGVLFREPSVLALQTALLQLKELEGEGRLTEGSLRRRSLRFSAARFRADLRQQVAEVLRESVVG
ncbi:MAG: glycosyltransferase [Myxococcota bacterium]|nr:glycosyltransferase [Myxococcota bacterium]